MEAPLPKPTWVRIISLLPVNLENVWSCYVCLERTKLSNADGNNVSAWNVAVL